MTHESIAVCRDCLFFIAYDEAPDHMDVEEFEGWLYKISRRSSSLQTLIADGEELGFSQSPCECCGSKLHGERYSMVVLTQDEV